MQAYTRTVIHAYTCIRVHSYTREALFISKHPETDYFVDVQTTLKHEDVSMPIQKNRLDKIWGPNYKKLILKIVQKQP